MNIDKELEAIFDDPLLKMSTEEEELFDIPKDMRRVIARKQADYVAQHKLCENFADYKPMFEKVHQELREGKRSLVKLAKTSSIETGQSFPSKATISRICASLNIPESYLLLFSISEDDIPEDKKIYFRNFGEPLKKILISD